MGKSCLGLHTLRTVAAGLCPTHELSAVQRHLASCERCRAGVVAAALGVGGLGDTVALERPSRSIPIGVKLAAVALSMAVAGGAWRYAAPAAPHALAPPGTVEAQAPQPAVATAPSKAQSNAIASEAAAQSSLLPSSEPLPLPPPAPAPTSRPAEGAPCVAARPTRSERPSFLPRPAHVAAEMIDQKVAAHEPAPVHSVFDGRWIRTTLD